MSDPRSIAVLGVTGYTGFELATLLLRHPSPTALHFYVRETKGAHSSTEKRTRYCWPTVPGGLGIP